MTKTKCIYLSLFLFYSFSLLSQSSRVPINRSDGVDLCGEDGDTGPCVEDPENPTNPAVRNSIGLNYNFSDESNLSIVEGICPNWRQFTLWHNSGYNPSEGIATECNTSNPTLDLITFPWLCDMPELEPEDGNDCIDVNSPHLSYEFDPTFTYNFSNFIQPPFDNQSRMNYILINEAEGIDKIYSAFNSSIDNLSTDYFLTNEWENGNNKREAIWRKPVPFWLNSNPTNSSNFLLHEDFLDKNSYRYFAEYMSYYTGMMGAGSPMPNHYNYEDGLPLTGLGFNNYVELWNEADAWWTWPNNYGYLTPEELATLCHAAIGSKSTDGYTVTSTNINGICTPGGIKTNRPGMQLISPSPHEMDLGYMSSFMNSLRNTTEEINNAEVKVRESFSFDVYAFHHYSAYSISDLERLFSKPVGNGNDSPLEFVSPTPEEIVAQSINSGGTTHPYRFGSANIETVSLEASPGDQSTGFWICPELDGYYQRGMA